jgi:hypothetical protein
MILFINHATAYIREILRDLFIPLFVGLHAVLKGFAASHLSTGFLDFPRSSSKF